jgi:hypothetical protein
LMRWLKAVAARIVADEAVAVDLPDDLGAPSADIIYQETLRTLADQQSDIQTLDAKASFFLTSATILVGTSGFPGTSTLFVERRDLLTVVLVIYFFLLICVVQAYRLRGLSPAGLRASELPEYLYEDPEYTKLQLITAMLETHQRNVGPVASKERWLLRAQLLLLAEALYLLAVVLFPSELQSGFDVLRDGFRWLRDWAE